MSIIIKSMDMPENCWECTGAGLNVSVSVFGGMCPYCEKIRTDHEMKTGRHPECPLVALPDKHGRLGDLDALIHELNNSHYPGAPYVDAGTSIAIGKICDASTIVEAEDGE